MSLDAIYFPSEGCLNLFAEVSNEGTFGVCLSRGAVSVRGETTSITRLTGSATVDFSVLPEPHVQHVDHFALGDE